MQAFTFTIFWFSLFGMIHALCGLRVSSRVIKQHMMRKRGLAWEDLSPNSQMIVFGAVLMTFTKDFFLWWIDVILRGEPLFFWYSDEEIENILNNLDGE